MPHLAQIFLYPIKSLDGVAVPSASFGAAGALQTDREFALLDREGRLVNGKRSPELHKIRSHFDLAARTVTLSLEEQNSEGHDAPLSTQMPTQTFELDGDRTALEDWLSHYLSDTITVQQDRHMGFPDDTEASGPTVISMTTLETVAAWFGMSVEETRQRFRANLEIADVPAFWEDQLYTPSGTGVAFQIGAAQLKSNNPCQRCVVPTRNPRTGDRNADFQKQFIAYRAATLPENVPRSHFNHFFRLALNTKVSILENGKKISVGDEVFW